MVLRGGAGIRLIGLGKLSARLAVGRAFLALACPIADYADFLSNVFIEFLFHIAFGFYLNRALLCLQSVIVSGGLKTSTDGVLFRRHGGILFAGRLLGLA
jgi:hypothetical protein